MSWKDLAWFDGNGNTTGESGTSQTVSDGSGSTNTVDGGTLSDSTSAWSSVSSDSGDSTTEGSGATPAITLAVDYWLRDEKGDVITDENGDGISLEGLNA